MPKNINSPVYKVKRFGSQHWIEKDGNHYSGPVYPLSDIRVPRYFNNPDDAWKWVEYLEEGVVDVPNPARLSPTGMPLDRINELTRWIPITERIPTVQDGDTGDITGCVIAWVQPYRIPQIVNWKTVADNPNYSHWKQIVAPDAK